MATTNTGICVLLWTEIGSTNSGEPSISTLLAEFPGLLPLMGYNRRQADSRDAARIVGTTNHGAYHCFSIVGWFTNMADSNRCYVFGDVRLRNYKRSIANECACDNDNDVIKRWLLRNCCNGWGMDVVGDFFYGDRYARIVHSINCTSFEESLQRIPGDNQRYYNIQAVKLIGELVSYPLEASKRRRKLRRTSDIVRVDRVHQEYNRLDEGSVPTSRFHFHACLRLPY